GKVRTVLFAETEGVPAEFAFASAPGLRAPSGKVTHADGRTIIQKVKPGRGAAVEIPAADGTTLRLVLLDGNDALAIWKGSWRGRDRVFLSRAGLVVDGDKITLTSTNPADLHLGVSPPPVSVRSGDSSLKGKPEGLFLESHPQRPTQVKFPPTAEPVRSAGPPRTILLGRIKDAVAAAPEDPD